MRRKYLNKIEVLRLGPVSDNFGGTSGNVESLGFSWANVKSVPVDRLVDYGLDINVQSVTIRTRYRSDLDYFQDGIFFRYLGNDWHPVRIYNKDLLDEEIVIIATWRNE